MRIFIVALFSLVLLRVGAPFAAAQTPERNRPARLEGHVLNPGGEPMRKVTLRLLGDAFYAGNVASMSDDAGGFLFEGIPPGTYTLTAEHTGFVTLKYGATSSQAEGTPLAFRVGETVKDVVMRMIPQGVILGRITNQDGEPMSGQQVVGSQFVYIRGKRQLQPVVYGSADDQGGFRLAGLAPGQYYVSAMGLRMVVVGTAVASPAANGAESELPTYYPGEIDPSRATALDVRPGAELRGIDIRMRRARSYSVRGTVNTATSVKLTDQYLTISSKDRGGVGMSARPGADGTFQFRGLPLGAYVIRAGLAAAGLGSAVAAPVEVNIADSDVDGIALTLTAGVDITGTVTLDAGKAPSRPMVLLRDPDTPEGRQAQAQYKEEGAFTIGSIAPAKYFVDIAAPPGSYVQAVRFGKQDATHALLDLTGGGGVLDVRLSSRVASISGTVKNLKGEPAAGTLVTVWTKQPDPGSLTGGSKVAVTDQNGGFHIGDLAPGGYYVAAWEDIEQGLTDASSFRVRFQGQAAEVTVGEGARESVDPPLIPRDQIAAEAAKLK